MRIRPLLAALSVFVPALLALPVATSPASAAHPVRPDVTVLPVQGVDATALTDVDPGEPGRPLALTKKHLTGRFSMLGVTWARGTGSGEVTTRIRTRESGRWSSWSVLEVAGDDGPDEVAAEARRSRRTGTEPLWVGAADGVQVRVDAEPEQAPRDIRVELIDPGTSNADSTLGRVPASSAAAATTRPSIITRAQWGADELLRTGSPSYASTVKVAYVHHTASSNSYTAEQAAAQVRSFYAYHTQSLGWDDIGYNFLVDKFGRIYEGRYGGVDKAVIGAHAGGFNSATVGVSMMGTHTSLAPSAATLTAVQDLLAWKLSLSGRNPLGKDVLTSGGGSTARYPAGQQVTVNVISGHRDTNLTECPGDAGYSKLPGIRQGVADRIARLSKTPIDLKHEALGGDAGFQGPPITPEGAAVGGRYRHYRNGSIYWSPATGAREVHGGVYGRWAGLNWERGFLGFPVTDELGTPDGKGRYNHFQGGSVYWSTTTGAWEVHGAIQQAWRRLGWEQGVLGYPLTNETGTPDGLGRYNHFQGGSVYWSPTTGAWEVRGAIRQRWAEQGWERSSLGYPTSDEYSVLGGRRSNFQRGYITWSAATGSTSVTMLK